MLMRDERLATLETSFDDATETLTISRDGKQVAAASSRRRSGAQLIEQFIAAYMEEELRGAPKIVSRAGHSFSDVAAKCVHIVNLATVRELERVVGRPVDPLRFRANLIIEGLEPWAEFTWLDKEIGIGAVRLRVFTTHAALRGTNVDPRRACATWTFRPPLQRNWGHVDFGVYAQGDDQRALAVGDVGVQLASDGSASSGARMTECAAIAGIARFAR